MLDTHKNKRFICDYYSPGMIIIKIIRAEVPGGIISGISMPELPADVGIIGFEDIPAEKDLHVFSRSMPLLCDGNIKYEGEPVLLLYGKDEKELDILASEIRIDYETDYTLASMETYTEEQVDRELKYSRGKPDRNFAKAHKIIEETYSTSSQHHYDLEPQGAAAMINEAGGVDITSATQWPFNVRDNVSECLGIPKKKVNIDVPAMGKTHSGKLWYAGLLACYAAIVTWKTNEPSFCLIPKTDSILYTPGRAASIIRHKTGIDENGKILCRSIDISIDSGACPMLSEEVINRICFSAAGVYMTPALEITARSIRTNNPPSGAFNGMGFHQSFFAGECHANSLAAAAGLGPLEWRKMNTARKHINLPIGWESRKPIQLDKLLDTVAEMSDYKRKHAAYSLSAKMQNDFSGKKRGIGISVCCQGNGFMGKVEENEKYTVSARLDTDGSLSLFTSAVPENFQTASLWRDIAGGILEINPDDVRIETVNTSLVPDSGPSLFSRNITIITQLIEKCCNAIKKSRFRLPLPIEVKRSYRLPRTNGWDPESFSGNPFPIVSWGAAVVETETDPITLETSIRGVWLAADCGKIMNIELAKAEIESEIFRSVISSTMKPPAVKYARLGIPLTPVQPQNPFAVRIEFLSSRENKPGGIGELPDSLIPAALSEALSMGLNIKLADLPSTSESLFRQLEHISNTQETELED
ncbi:MAG: xanthine dehydrogenase family protein [Spirochaetales bacterium]|uniref:Xanthine dehydrogenase family protein n=1 Tax=Candidatus Thalassospirochaeta sargassi TaxID=3119039 RepID=A0AAJ1IFA4_9SPIO|nr:xanthine dehydrogenase family protein [Spirochaetales bacterium]